MKTEKALTVAFLVGILFKLLHWPFGSMITVLASMGLAIIYFAFAFYFFCDREIRRQNLALSIMTGFLLSVIPIGVLFKIQYWPGADLYLMAGIITAPVILLISIYLKSRSSAELRTYYQNMVIRTSVMTFISILLFLTSGTTLLKLQYGEDPELLRLKMLEYSHPDNQEYRRQSDEYIMKKYMQPDSANTVESEGNQ